MKKKLLIFIPSLSGGGAERVVANLVNNLDESKYEITLLMLRKQKIFYDINPGIKIDYLHKSSLKYSLPALIKYLRNNRPDLMMTHMSLTNVISVLARKLSKVKFPLILVEHSTLSIKYKNDRLGRRIIPFFMKLTYYYAEKIVCVSKESAKDLRRLLKLDNNKICHIYNPIIDNNFAIMKNESVDHIWLKSQKYQVILGVGRLEKVKNFKLLIESFSIVLKTNKNIRLIILGEGSERGRLEKLLKKLNIEEYVCMPGFIKNPYAYLDKSDLFVLSSELEGLPTVLIEALSCGIPCVSTNCPSGPKEILMNGTYGVIVPRNDKLKMAKAIKEQLNRPYNKKKLISRGLYFNVENSIKQYEDLIDSYLNYKERDTCRF